MRRFLLSLGYCGTSFRGVQKQLDEGVSIAPCSVQGVLEEALNRLHLVSPPTLFFSSRTDKGVHALCNTAHVDLEQTSWRRPFDPKDLTLHLNRYFQKANLDIRVNQTVLVPPTFHARFDAIGRTYLYRLAVIKPEADSSQCTTRNLDALLPISELQRLYIVRSPFDVAKVRAACQLLEGVHDFGAFCSKSSYNISTKRAIDKISIQEGRPLLNPAYEPLSNSLQYWDVTVEARSFLYKQVRRTVGILVALAQGQISLEHVQWMLDNPDRHSWPTRAITAPAEGLYLIRVHYCPQAFDFPHPDFTDVDSLD